jgi:hypothetical protein
MRQSFLVATLLWIGSAGCSMATSLDPPETPPDGRAAAVVVVERTSGPGDTVRADTVVARFVRARQGTLDDQALRIAGAGWDWPAVGTCSSVAQQADVGLRSRALDLLDVGTLTVAETGVVGKNTRLLPRTMFDPTGSVSGVVYSARPTDAFSSVTGLAFSATGGPDLPAGFDVTIKGPREMNDVRAVVNDARSSLDVTWDVAESDENRDLVYIDVLSTSTSSARLITRCTATDAGQWSIPNSSLSGIFEGQVAVHRLHREAFRAKGIERGEVRFDVARVVNFRR